MGFRTSRPAPRIARTVPIPVREKDPRKDSKHLDFVRGLPCLICAKPARSEAAHIRVGTDGGMAIKPSDRFTVPLCHGHHMTQHQKGELTFWSEANIDPMSVASRLWTISGDQFQGERAVIRARQQAELNQVGAA